MNKIVLGIFIGLLIVSVCFIVGGIYFNYNPAIHFGGGMGAGGGIGR